MLTFQGIRKIMAEKETAGEIMVQEELVRERLDKNGEKWTKKHVGGGAHFVNWLEQYREICSESGSYQWNLKISNVQL